MADTFAIALLKSIKYIFSFSDNKIKVFEKAVAFWYRTCLRSSYREHSNKTCISSSTLSGQLKHNNLWSCGIRSYRPVSILSGAAAHLNFASALLCCLFKTSSTYGSMQYLFLNRRYVLSLFLWFGRTPWPDSTFVFHSALKASDIRFSNSWTVRLPILSPFRSYFLMCFLKWKAQFLQFVPPLLSSPNVNFIIHSCRVHTSHFNIKFFHCLICGGLHPMSLFTPLFCTYLPISTVWLIKRKRFQLCWLNYSGSVPLSFYLD